MKRSHSIPIIVPWFSATQSRPSPTRHKMTNQKLNYLISSSHKLPSYNLPHWRNTTYGIYQMVEKSESKTHSISKLLVTVLKMAAITSRISFDSNSTVLSVEPNRTEASRDITRSLQDSNKHNMQKKKLIANTLPLKNNTSYCLVWGRGIHKFWAGQCKNLRSVVDWLSREY